jgi:hypothetical protein
MLEASFPASLLITRPVVEAALAPDPEPVAPEAALVAPNAVSTLLEAAALEPGAPLSGPEGDPLAPLVP